MGYSVLSKYRSELMGAAMLWVMLFHAADLTFPIPGLDLFRAAGFGGVDIFILLSAMGLSLSLSRREQEYGAFLVRRARRILPAYFVVMVPYTLFLILRGQAPLSALVWNSTLLAYWVHTPGAFNWYVSGILLFYVLTPWCFLRLRRSRHRVLWTAGAGAAAVAVCHVLIQDEYWHYLDVFYRFPIFFLGLLMGLYMWEDRRLGRRDLLFWTLWLAAGLCYLAAALPRLEVPHLPMCHLFLFTTVPMCLAGCACFEHLPLGWLRRGLRLVGEHSLEIYLLNVSLFSETALLRSWLPLGTGPYYFLAFFLNILLGILLHRGVEAGMRRIQARRAD